MFFDRANIHKARPLTAGMTGLVFVPALVLLGPQQPDDIQANTTPVKPSVSIESAWTSDLEPIAPTDAMSRNVYWAPATGEN